MCVLVQNYDPYKKFHSQCKIRTGQSIFVINDYLSTKKLKENFKKILPVMLSNSNFHIIVMYIKDFFHASDNLSISTLTDLHSETFFEITVYFIAFFYLVAITIKKLGYDLE